MIEPGKRIAALSSALAALEQSSRAPFGRVLAAREAAVASAFHAHTKKRTPAELVFTAAAGVAVAPPECSGPPVILETAQRSGAMFAGAVAANYLQARARQPRLGALDTLHAYVILDGTDTVLTQASSAWLGLAMRELRQACLDAQIDLDVALQRFSRTPQACKPGARAGCWPVRTAALGLAALQRLRGVLGRHIHRLARTVEACPELETPWPCVPESFLTRASNAYQVIKGEAIAVRKAAAPSPFPTVQRTSAL